MGYFHYALLFIFGALMIAAIKADYQARLWITFLIVAVLVYYAMSKKKR